MTRGQPASRPAPPPLEKDLQAAIVHVLELHGYAVSDLSQPRATMQTPGLPDLYCQHPRRGVHFWIEVKRPEGRVSESQRRWHETEVAAGGAVLLLRSAVQAHEVIESLHRYLDRGGVFPPP